MKEYQREFLDFAIACEALRFGEFTLKSGRISPYFFNSGLFNTGAKISRLARYYAAAIEAASIEYDMLFGPAYKGVPLAVAIAMVLAQDQKKDVPYAFNRKEAKKYGEGGLIIGSLLSGNVLIVDDVISAGTAVRESFDIVHSAGATPVGVAIALDRQERGTGEISAIQEVEQNFGVRVISIVRLEHLLAYLAEKDKSGRYLDAISTYRKIYGT